MDPLTRINTRRTPQTQRADPRQTKNSAGGYSFSLDDKARALRFLILGTEGGTYYISEQKLTKANAANIVAMANGPDAKDLLDLVLDVSLNGRAAKQNPTLFTLAALCAAQNDQVRRAALAEIPNVCRTGYMLFTFLNYVEQFRGWGKGLQRAIGRWYAQKMPDQVGFQATKYRQRNGWTHGDVLALAHIGAWNHNSKTILKPETHRPVLDWIQGHDFDSMNLPRVVEGYQLAQIARTPARWAGLVSQYRLAWEMLPDEALKHPMVWEALVPHMGMTAIVRKLAQMTRVGFITPMSRGTKLVVERLSNDEDIRKSRVHPIQMLLALATYQAGRGYKNPRETWNPVGPVIDALDAGFYSAFGNVEPTGKRTLVALDVSGSMRGGDVAGTFLTPVQAEMALAMLWVQTEPQLATMAFSGGFVPLNLSKRMRVDDAVRQARNMPFDRTDCAQPMLWAERTGLAVDTFIVITDAETWAGYTHPHQALRKYRQSYGIDARLCVVGMTSNGFTIADPSDAGMLDVVGFDTATPNIISNFSLGNF